MTADLRAQCIDEGLTDAAECRGVVGAAGEDHLDVGTRAVGGCRRRGEQTGAADDRRRHRAKPSHRFQKNHVRHLHTWGSAATNRLLAVGAGHGYVRPAGLGDPLGAVALAGQGQPDEYDHAADRLGERDRLPE